MADAYRCAEDGRSGESFERRVRAVRWPKPRRRSDQSDTDSVGEIPTEPAQPASTQDETAGTESSTAVGEPDRDEQPTGAGRPFRWSRAITCGVLPGLALLLASAAGYLKCQDAS